jgi:hypothetical protein
MQNVRGRLKGNRMVIAVDDKKPRFIDSAMGSEEGGDESRWT